MSEQHEERRRFKRIAFEAPTFLRQEDMQWEVKLLDISLKGWLIERPQPWQGDAQKPFVIEIRLSSDASILMDGSLAHDDHGQLGFELLHIGIDSIYHLRRVVEWNIHDEAELERELGELIDPTRTTRPAPVPDVLPQ